jgi:hypothetical protein
LDKSQIYNKWKPILDSLNVTDEKKEWLSKYAEMHSPNQFCGPIEVDPNEVSGYTLLTDNLLPIFIAIASNTAGFDLVGVKPMTGPSAGVPKLNEEKYLNERRKKILEEITNMPEIDFDKIDEIEDTDYKKLEDMKEDFMESQPGLFYLDFKYPSKKIKIWNDSIS